jgi:2-C-methyl-D-erythritol 4-phosphate cytidylyltransferase
MTKHIAIIVAGGSGSRMGTKVPKQFHLISDYPVLYHAVDLFSEADLIVVVLHPEYRHYWDDFLERHPETPHHVIVPGGDTRYQSVKNGLNAIPGKTGIVSIHDAARPLASRELVQKAYETALRDGSAVPVIPIEDTVREIDEKGSRIIDRKMLYRVQTPQAFQLPLLREAYEQPFEDHFTDDAALLENMGKKPVFIPGEKYNIKITFPEDFDAASALLRPPPPPY